METDKLNQIIDTRLANQLKGSLFTARKITDLPTDGLQVTNRNYVTLNGTTTNRPVSSVVGQFYLDTTLGYPVWWNGTGWIDATGTYH